MNERWLRLLICVGLFSASTADAAPPMVSSAVLATPSPILKRYNLPSKYTEAQCNDGSPYAIYYRPGVGRSAQNLVIWFQGGGSCHDDATCLQRWYPDSPLMSSNAWAPNMIQDEGLLSTDQTVSPVAHDAVIFLRYCTSDAFTGTRDPFPVAGLTFDLRFSGAHNTEAVIDLLVTAPPPGIPPLKQARRIIVAGHSAGSGGVLAHADRFAAAAGRQPAVYAIADAAWLFDYPSNNPDVVAQGGIAPYLGSMVDYWYGKLDDTCEQHALSVGTAAARGNCLLGSAASTFIDTPMFVGMAQQDPPLFHYYQPSSVSDMGAALRDALNQSAIQGAFSLDDSVHGYLKTTASLLDDASGASPKEVLNAFLAQPGNPSAFHIVP